MADYVPEPFIENDEPELSADEVAESLARDAQDARADAEFVREPFQPRHSASVMEFFAEWAEDELRQEAEAAARTVPADMSWLDEHDPNVAPYGEIYAHPEDHGQRERPAPERVL